MFKRITAGLLCLALISGVSAAISGCSDSQQTASVDFQNADNIRDGAILQCFCWDFNTIRESMADIAAAGFTALQTSPINECLEGENGGMELYGNGKWYYHYQPTDFKIGNYQLGTRDEFKAMCEEADKYGIKVIVDVIANHTTPITSAVSEDLINAGGGSLETLYHQGNANDLVNYSDRLMCTTYKMGGLPDINTERTSFQDYFIEFINDCIACGADGFRYDTAKHIGLPDDPKEDDGFTNNFWERVITEIDNADNIFNYGEVLQGDNDRIADYINTIGATTSSTYGTKIRDAVKQNNLFTAIVSDYRLGSAPLNMVTWVESHDNYINDDNWYNMTDEQVILGWAIITARKDGTPLFFDRPYNSSVDNEWGMNRIGTAGDDMYKDERVKAVNFFRTAMIGEDEKLVNPENDGTALMIERGTKGVVIVNTKDELETGFETSLEDGKYIDRVDNTTQYSVKNGILTSDSPIKENSVVVLYNEGYVKYADMPKVGVADDTIFAVESDSAQITLTCANTENAVYSLNGGAETLYTDGESISVTFPENSNVSVLELRAENAEGLMTYERIEFSHKETYSVPSGTQVYFQPPESGWKSDVFAYVYDDSSSENSSWPGIKMADEGGGIYSYTFTASWENPYIIFNDGSVQYPEGQGLKVEADKTYTTE